MRNFSGVGLGLSLVFGFLLLALIAELYYLLWWKKKRITDSRSESIDDEYGKFAKDLFHFICWKRPNPSSTAIQSENSSQAVRDLEKEGKEEWQGVESELMRLHNLAGPPRFLFPIKEETREDLESAGGRSRTRSLSDFMLSASGESPMRSPAPATAVMSDNPLFESSLRPSSSPPPKFKFLRDAEEKLYRRLVAEAEKRKRAEEERLEACNHSNNENDNGDESNSDDVFSFPVGNENLPHCPSGSASQVLPLPSSPSQSQSSKPFMLN